MRGAAHGNDADRNIRPRAKIPQRNPRDILQFVKDANLIQCGWKFEQVEELGRATFSAYT